MSNTRKRRRPQAASGNGHSLRARLAARERPHLDYPLLVDDPTGPRERLARAQQALRVAVVRYDEAAHGRARERLAEAGSGDEERLAELRRALDGHDRAEQAVADARAELNEAAAELEACYETVRLRAMRPEAYEQLIADHPPTAEQQADPDSPPWNEKAFIPALLAACAEGDMTADDWSALLAGDDDGHGLSRAERFELRTTVVGLNEKARFADPAALPFASTMTRSWPWN